MVKRQLPDKIETKDLIAGNVKFRNYGKPFFRQFWEDIIISEKITSEKDLRSESLASDLIHATTCDKWKRLQKEMHKQ